MMVTALPGGNLFDVSLDGFSQCPGRELAPSAIKDRRFFSRTPGGRLAFCGERFGRRADAKLVNFDAPFAAGEFSDVGHSKRAGWRAVWMRANDIGFVGLHRYSPRGFNVFQQGTLPMIGGQDIVVLVPGTGIEPLVSMRTSDERAG